MTPQQGYWKHGQQAEIARLAGIPESHLSNILHRSRGCSVTRAKALEAASDMVLGVRIPWEIWVCNRQTNHPAFTGEPVAEES
jgi:hypothetical protein